MKKIIVLILVFLFIVGCNNSKLSRDISVDEVYNNILTGKYIIIDVREEDEYKQGHIQNAINLPISNIDKSIGDIILNKNTNIVLYCHGGSRSREAVTKLENLGYTNLFDMGGIINWTYELVK